MTEVTRLADEAARLVVEGSSDGSLGTTVFVDAGAGTGKTTALVRRVVNLVLAGVQITEVAAITFTEAAAAELRHRVRSDLERRLEGAQGQDRDLLEAALRDLDDATFSTLHAFAMGILLDHPLEAGLPPTVDLLDEIEEAATFEHRWDAWLSHFVERDEVEPLLEHLDLLDVSIHHVRKLATHLHEHYHRIPHDLRTVPTHYQAPPLALDELFAAAAELQRLADNARAPTDKLVAHLQMVATEVARLRAAVDNGADLATQIRMLGEVEDLPLASNVGSGKVWADKSEVIAKRRAIRDEVLPAIRREQYDHLLRALAAFVGELVLGWANDRGLTGTLIFQDLLVLARDVLRDDAAVRNDVRARYRHLLIDEFQDTDPLQIEIAVLLGTTDPDGLAANQRPDGSLAWENADLIPGRLFFVGDPKQSIYAFRGADIAVYEGAHQAVTTDGVDQQLTHNFRSVPGILDWVNATFEQLFEPRHRAQPTYHRLTGARPPIAGAPPSVQWFGGNDDTYAEEMREDEATDTVAVARQLIGRVTVTDPVTGEPRRARPSDIAILVRRHSTARQLERHFDEAGMPLVVQARSLVFSTDEVRELTTLLTAIEDPTDQVAIIGALRQPSMGCSDADLVGWVANGGRWWLPQVERESEPDADDVPADHPVARGLHRLASLRRDRWEASVGGFVEHVIAELDLLEVALGRPRHRDRWRRLRFVADQGHRFHDAGGSLRGFVRWLREQADEGVRRDEHVVGDLDDDAVRVTTVHAAKGLEYPIVIALGLDMDLSKPVHSPVLLWGNDGRIEFNVSSAAKSAGFATLMAEERVRHREEETRLLYVEMTRARDLLVVSRHHRAAKSHGARLAELDGLEDLWEPMDIGPVHDQVPSGPPPGPRPGRADEVASFSARHAATRADATRPRVLAATRVRALIDEGSEDLDPSEPDGPEERDQDTDTTEVPTDTQPWRRGRAGSAVGRAVHAVLQSVDLATFDDVDALARAQCAAEGLPPTDAPAVARMARRAGSAPIVQAAVAAGTFWREIHVGAPVALPTGDTITLEGFIDLLVEVDGELVIVDYKTDRVGDRSPEQVVATYRPQAATYALALEASLGRPVTRAVFVLTGTPGSADPQVEVAGDDLAAARTELLTGLAEVR